MPIRVDARTAQVQDFPSLEGLGEEKANKRLLEIQRGGEVKDEHKPFPERRPFQDAFWIMLFVALTVLMMVIGYMKFGSIAAHLDEHQNLVDNVEMPAGRVLIASVVGAAVASIVAAFVMIWATARYPACMVWTSLVFGPGLIMVLGFGMLVLSTMYGMYYAIFGAFLAFFGLLGLTCVFCCYSRFVPFTIQMAKVVATVIQEHSCMFAIALIGVLLSIVWTLACFVAFTGLASENQELLEGNARYVVVFICAFCFVWGAQVASNICHVTYCYVFGSWYYGNDRGSPLMNGLRVATTTSLGSICFGSFLIAIVRAMEQMARQVRRDAQADGNIVACIVALILECVISCIGDILEYFNDWAYVQCAVRGVSFINAARITYSMMTCANVQYIIQDLLLNSLASSGALFCAFIAAAAGAGFGYGLDSNGIVAAAWGGALGFFIGLISGSATMTVISSGTKTILACWADDPAKLQAAHPQEHEEFEKRIIARCSA